MRFMWMCHTLEHLPQSGVGEVGQLAIRSRLRVQLKSCIAAHLPPTHELASLAMAGRPIGLPAWPRGPVALFYSGCPVIPTSSRFQTHYKEQ